MTVKELIEELKKYPEHLQVMYNDYEYGHSEITDVKPEKQYNYRTREFDNIVLIG